MGKFGAGIIHIYSIHQQRKWSIGTSSIVISAITTSPAVTSISHIDSDPNPIKILTIWVQTMNKN